MTFFRDSAVRGATKPIFEGDTHLQVIRTYCRTVGAIQLLYATYLGWAAFPSLRWAVHQICRVVQNGFRLEGKWVKDKSPKDVYMPAIDIDNLTGGTILALLAFDCLVGGCGLLIQRPWARGWAITYLILLTASTFPIDMQRDHHLRNDVLGYLGLALPYMPLLFLSPTYQVVSGDKARPSGLGLDDLAG